MLLPFVLWVVQMLDLGLSAQFALVITTHSVAAIVAIIAERAFVVFV